MKVYKVYNEKGEGGDMSELNLEQCIFEIISHGGNAKSTAYDALEKAKAYDFTACDDLMAQADDELTEAHKTQTTLIQTELQGESFEKSLLLIHAQDHLMTAISEMSLIKEMIDMYRKMSELEQNR